MTMIQSVGSASNPVIATLIAGLESEFGRGASEGLAQHFLSAEAVDFRWEGRVAERWLGAYEGADDDGFWLDRIAIFGQLDGAWYHAVMIVDGEGQAHGMIGCRAVHNECAARTAMEKAR